MSLEKFVDTIAEVTDRRRFLKKLGVATLGVTAGALGYSAPASAAPFCCNLCYPSGAGSSCSGCACRWSWQCCHRVGVSGLLYECGECFSSTSCPGCCQRTCDHVKCSWYRSLNTYCV
jgi:hypothetical protein